MPTPDPDKDDRIYLEESEGAAALQWVARQNQLTLQRLENDPRFEENQSAMLAAFTDPRRIAYPSFTGANKVENFWQDELHERGILREADWESYLRGAPQWETILDIDKLAAEEGRDWVYAGCEYLPTDSNRCLFILSEGGKDAVVIREFDISTKRFVEGGFELPEAKQNVTWVDEDTLYISGAWCGDDVTASGYSYTTRKLKRGQSIAEGEEIFRGERSDISAERTVLRDLDGNHIVDVSYRIISEFETEMRFITVESEVGVLLPLPFSSAFLAYHQGQALFQLQEDWVSAEKTKFVAGSIISFDLGVALKSPDSLNPVLVFSPSPHQTVEEVAQTKNYVIIQLLSNVQGEVYAYTFRDCMWFSERLPLPENQTLSAYSTHLISDEILVSAEGFLKAETLYLVNASSLHVKLVQSSPDDFDASGMDVQQRWVKSKDGTHVPYYVVSRAGISLDGSNPTLLYAYGGFGVAVKPFYLGQLGKLWLERGGIYVLANIRGGGEFGVGWHLAGLKTNRQSIFDDFQAVAEDIIASKMTSPTRLGIMGGSNGGLLMGVQLIQRPELWNAVVAQAPLLDMQRYTQLLAGPSWIGEYGDPDDPVEGAFLRSISPYHNLRPGVVYPEPLFTSSKNDDRVHPGHARKMAAKMEDIKMPFLYYESPAGGHNGAGTPIESASITAIELTYLMQKLMD